MSGARRRDRARWAGALLNAHPSGTKTRKISRVLISRHLCPWFPQRWYPRKWRPSASITVSITTGCRAGHYSKGEQVHLFAPAMFVLSWRLRLLKLARIPNA